MSNQTNQTDGHDELDTQAQQSAALDSDAELKAEPEPEPEAKVETSSEPQQTVIVKKSGGAITGLALLLSLGACAASAYLWFNQKNMTVDMPELPEFPDYQPQFDQLATELATKTDQVGNDVSQQLQTGLSQYDSQFSNMGTQVDAVGNRIDALQSALGASEARLEQANSGWDRRFSVIENSISSLADLAQKPDAELGLLEIEYLLSLANERLELFADPVMAVKALGIADDQIQALDDAAYTSVRRMLGEEIQRLQAVEWPDRVILVENLAQLARQSSQLPIDARRSLSQGSANLLEPVESDGEGLWSDFKSMLSSVVVVHREQSEEIRLLTLDEERLLKENLRLQFQVAQLAVAQSDQGLFNSSLETGLKVLEDYYQSNDEAVISTSQQITELLSIELNPELPDISGSLRQLRQMRAAIAIGQDAESVQ